MLTVSLLTHPGEVDKESEAQRVPCSKLHSLGRWGFELFLADTGAHGRRVFSYGSQEGEGRLESWGI